MVQSKMMSPRQANMILGTLFKRTSYSVSQSQDVSDQLGDLKDEG